MPDYSIHERPLQVVKADKSELYLDPATGEVVESLRDDKFPWKVRKQGTLRLSDVYKHGQMGRCAERAKTCSTYLEYLTTETLDRRQLNYFNACHLRLCPICAARKAKIMARRLKKIMKAVQSVHPDVQFIFLTLTIKNVKGDKLREGLDQLTKAWHKLIKRRPFDRAVKGWFRAIEITRNRQGDTYHPHIHAILVVEPDYFTRSSGLYLTHDKWVEMWQQSLQVAYKPSVRIQRTKAKPGQPDNGRGGYAEAAAVEAAKYATKDSEYIAPQIPIDEAAEVAKVYTEALTRKRMTALGGWMLEASQDLDVDPEDDSDLVHADDDTGELTKENAAFLEKYGWHFGVADHVLTSRAPNPDFVQSAAPPPADRRRPEEVKPSESPKAPANLPPEGEG